VYRRICFLRSEGLPDEAQVIQETEFAEAAARARSLLSPGSGADSLLRELMAEEEERVAQAVAFAEVLVPMLARRLPLRPSAPPHAGPPEARARAQVGPGAARGVADFIDDMLAQDSLAPR
jgi:hypothetical protein